MIKRILATDCGSTTTKAILIEKNNSGEYRLFARGEAPTTVETPFEDVTIGVLNAVYDLEEQILSYKAHQHLEGSWNLIKDQKILHRSIHQNTSEGDGKEDGVDLYVSTSSAGGGLQMMVAGVVRSMSAESAERAALGAGAIIMDTLAIDDGRKEFERAELLRKLRPDIILFAGGTDGGTRTHLLDMAEIIHAADPKPRFGTLKLPVIFAGNQAVKEEISKIFGDQVELKVIPNLRPALDTENLDPARKEIHELFLKHVMQQAPGYNNLMAWTHEEIMATPNAVGMLIESYAKNEKLNVLGVDIGGATTDVFSFFNKNYHRTVSANLGMSYSVCNVLKEAGISNIARWLPFQIDQDELANRLRNKMIRPTTLPQTYEDLLIEQAVAREALRLAFEHHKALARSLKGSQQTRDIGEIFEQNTGGTSLVNMMKLDMIIGSGGVLSHAPLREQSVMMMLDAFQPEGITMLAIDSIFMMPHLGVLSQYHYEISKEVFEKDCLIKCGHCIAPVGQAKENQPCLKIQTNLFEENIQYGEIKQIPMDTHEKINALLIPSKEFDIGAGKGKALEVELEGGVIGITIDARGRPLQLPKEPKNQQEKMRQWMRSMKIKPPNITLP